MKNLNHYLLVLSSIVVIVVTIVLFLSVSNQMKLYNQALQAIHENEPWDVQAAISVGRSLDFALAKLSSLLLAYFLIFLGCAFTLRATEQLISMNVQGASGFNGTIQTASPGLFMIVVGAVLVVLLSYNKSTVFYGAPDDSSEVDINAVQWIKDKDE